MNARQFFDLVVEMRKAQQGYFAIRKSNDAIAKNRHSSTPSTSKRRLTWK